MASRSVLSEDEFCCPVCFKIFEDPVLLSCSHSFCRTCLERWWTEDPKQECPVCKARSTSRNLPRNLALKNLCEAFSQKRLQKPSSGSEQVCSLHSEKLQLFCLDHQQPVCHMCWDSEEHTNHIIRPIKEAARLHRAEVQKSLGPLQEKLKVLQEAKGDWVQTGDQIKVQAQQTEENIYEDFQKLQKVLQDKQEAVICALREEVDIKSEMVKEKIEGLNREIEDISDSIRAVEKQLEAPDVSFLQNYKDTVKRTYRPLPLEPQCTSEALIDVEKHLDQNQSLVEEIQQILRFRLSESVTHAGVWMESGLMKYACKLRLDQNTVNYQLSLSEDNRKVTWGENQSYPDHPDRFTYWPQVLCREGLTGRCYWEVDWRGWVNIGVTYRGIRRKGPDDGDSDSDAFFINNVIGYNTNSWCLACKKNSCTVCHYSKKTEIPLPSSSSVSNRVGVYVDWPAGSLSFYTVSSDTLTHLHTFFCTFTQPLVPGFSVGPDASVSLCHME